MKVLVTGGTGLVGSKVGQLLVQNNHEVIVVSRSKQKALQQLTYPAQIIECDLNETSIPNMPEVDAVIHLAGESVGGGRWTDAVKKKILQSREKGTAHLLASFKKAPPVFVSASAIGIYGDRGSEVLTEASKFGEGFLSEVCQTWESTVQNMSIKWSSTRFVTYRIGVVLSLLGGALPKMLTPITKGVGGALGSGKQMMSWIHIDDLAKLIVEAVENPKFQGTYNATAPEPVSNELLTELICKKIQKPNLFKVPGFMLKIILGEMSEIVLASSNVIPQRLLEQKFVFKFANIEQALSDLLQYHTDDKNVFIAEQFVPYKPEQVFPFFAEAQNLNQITPPLLDFKILSTSTDQVEKGTFIEYSLKIHGVPVKWRTLIDVWDPPHVFVDTQLKGPYNHWYHTHEFREMGNGTLMIDRVQYRVPLSTMGEAVAGSFVLGDVQKIFAYRREIIAQLKFERR